MTAIDSIEPREEADTDKQIATTWVRVGDWGLARVTIQVLMTCIVVNCKKIAKLAASHLPKAQTRLAWAYS